VTTLDWHGTGVSVRAPAIGVGAQILLLGLLWVGVGLRPAGWLAGTAYAVILSVLLTFALLRSRTRSLGPADRVTLVRAELVGGVTALVATTWVGRPTPTGFIVVLASVALVLDAVDGYVARRTGTVSALGARFDMEVDAFLILVLSVFVASSVGAWVLAIGAMRYAFAAAAWAAPWLRAPLPPSFARKTVAALQGIILVVASAGVTPAPVATGLVGLALASLTWSFGRDIGWLWRNRLPRPLTAVTRYREAAVPVAR
jgi:phosphatidylglycerophosphate synthase